MTTVIKVDSLSKRYSLGQVHTNLLSERLGNSLRSLVQKVRGRNLSPLTFDVSRPKDFWALKDVNFEVKQGEVVGIIGRNGAGKSTLLKIISCITEPTEGQVEIYGRVGSLLEVGTGFHPELTGRENIFLNGALMGMGKAEIKKKFDEIVAFAEVEKFLDTPIKRYSSGMYVRLAFAVAAHLEPEILLVDEVLAVGDAAFQKKCLGKMGEVAREGRTVLFVSHNMAAIAALCQRAICLNQGQINYNSETDLVIRNYMEDTSKLFLVDLQQRQDRKGTGQIRFNRVELLDNSGKPIKTFMSGQSARIRLHISNPCSTMLKNLHVAIGIDDEFGNRISHLNTDTSGSVFPEVPLNYIALDVILPRIPLMPGRYVLTLFSKVNNEIADWIENAFTFDVQSGDFFGTGRLVPEGQGKFLIEHKFLFVQSRSGNI